MKKLVTSLLALSVLAACETLDGHEELTAPCAPGERLAALDNPCERKPINLASLEQEAFQ